MFFIKCFKVTELKNRAGSIVIKYSSLNLLWCICCCHFHWWWTQSCIWIQLFLSTHLGKSSFITEECTFLPPPPPQKSTADAPHVFTDVWASKINFSSVLSLCCLAQSKCPSFSSILKSKPPSLLNPSTDEVLFINFCRPCGSRVPVYSR